MTILVLKLRDVELGDQEQEVTSSVLMQYDALSQLN